VSCSSKKKIQNPVHTDSAISDDLKTALEDVERLLSEVVSENFVIEYVIQKNQKRHLGYQEAQVTANDELLIVNGGSENAIIVGLYSYLHEFGFRWYFPGELWTIKPQRVDKLLNISKKYSPYFSARRFYGGGGFAYGHPLDPQNNVPKSWNIWSMRNRFGMEYKSKGHSWSDFYIRNRSTLNKHPEYLATPLTDSNLETVKLCTSNERVVALFMEDRLKKIEENIIRYGADSPEAKTIGVEPTDGKGHCECSKCVAQGSISNRVFGLANKVSRAINKKYPNILVSLLAYSEHAAPPDFQLEDNILVTLSPYRFQTYSSPNEMIEVWGTKAKHLQVLDYWALIVYNNGKPDKGFLDVASQKINQWGNNNVLSAQIETTYGIGPAGIPLYLFARLSFDEDADAKSITKEMMSDLFGSAAPDMKRLFERWSNDGYQRKKEEYLSFRDFEKAKKSTRDELVLKRIEQWEFYHAFLQMAEKLADENLKESKDALLKQTIDQSWSMMTDLMIHSYWISRDFLKLYTKSYDWRGHRSRVNRASYSHINSPKKVIIKPVASNSELVKHLIEKPIVESVKNEVIHSASEGLEEREIRSIQTYDIYFKANKKSKIYFDIDLEDINSKELKRAAIISVFDENEKEINSKKITELNNLNQFLELPKSGFYRINIKPFYVRTVLTWKDPKNTFVKKGTQMDPGNYYYKVPEGVKRVYFDRLVKGQKINNLNGKRFVNKKEDGFDYIEILPDDNRILWFDGWTVLEILGAESDYYPLTY